MNNKILNIILGLKSFASKNSPVLLTALAIGGLGTTVFMTIRGSRKADLIVYNELDLREKHQEEPLTFKEELKLTWKCYIPAAVTGIATVGCILGANSINARRRAVLAGAYALSETALREYQDKIEEIVGHKKATEVKDAVAKDRLKKAEDNQVIIMAGSESLCFDAPSGRYFKSDIEKLRQIQNSLNKRMFTEMFISSNDIYDDFGIEHIAVGDGMGFDINHNGLINFSFSCQLTQTGVPCLVVDYMPRPKWDVND